MSTPQQKMCLRTIIGQGTFSATCFPVTMTYANSIRKKIQPMLRFTPRAWPFPDRLLVWVWPFFSKDVRAFHHSNGKGISEIFQDHQIDHLDENLMRTLEVKLKTHN